MSIDYTIPDDAYVPTEVEKAGIKAFMKAKESNTNLLDAIKEIDPELASMTRTSMTRTDLIREWLTGWEMAENYHLCNVNTDLAERYESTTFKPGKILTLKVKVVERSQTARLLSSMYSPKRPTIAGCVVEAIGFSDYMGELEQVRKELARLANPSSETTYPRMIT